ncbi:TIGR03087 family PEP-CTERM/XrtA system glycosyltransferase [Govanella unica]|uniref:TIGR03087 family PEP-CTERM/XrtA system glycosyltransferase n=1 Tax=Govanella unica TaxID=2975056 RepID=A0A9X3Z6Y4_9PROT|nr:TIGR03087 family PEP-CTERM/XrtA system glycosyltransferase [Govania unica]MDA5193606.1 TIGR03087 family PEP-CTERM/XrtA system glycosyltransferase [Govania unica]
MADILFLAHRIPYPPNKGDKIRSWHMLLHLAKRHSVYLGCFVDDPEDMAHVAFLRTICADVCALPINPLHNKIRSLQGLLRDEALSVAFYRDARMTAWVDRVLGQGPMAATVLFSSPVGQFILGRGRVCGRTVMDFVDIDSDKWRQYAENKPWPMSWIYQREQRKLLAFERKMAATVQSSLFVSPKEAELFQKLAPEVAARVGHLNNGVDFNYFSPDHVFPSPYKMGERALVFTGAMDYWANVDAVDWFARAIFPQIRAAAPDTVFYIVGGKPMAAVQALRSLPGVVVTGRVEDVRPYVAHAALAVCPLRIARGIQNKVLEGMAMAQPVVATPQAFEGIEATPGEHLLVADGVDDFAATVLDVLSGRVDPELGARARNCVMTNYSWDQNLKVLDILLDIQDND